MRKRRISRIVFTMGNSLFRKAKTENWRIGGERSNIQKRVKRRTRGAGKLVISNLTESKAIIMRKVKTLGRP